MHVSNFLVTFLLLTTNTALYYIQRPFQNTIVSSLSLLKGCGVVFRLNEILLFCAEFPINTWKGWMSSVKTFTEEVRQTSIESRIRRGGELNRARTHKELKFTSQLNCKTALNKTGVINDPLGQTHSSEHCYCLKFNLFWKVGTDGRTDGWHEQKTIITTGHDFGLASWINNKNGLSVWNYIDHKA